MLVLGLAVAAGQSAYDNNYDPVGDTLAATAMVGAGVVGIGLGVYTGIKRNSWVSRIVMAVSLIGVSLPTFIIGIALIFPELASLHSVRHVEQNDC